MASYLNGKNILYIKISIPIPNISNQYHTKTIWKWNSTHMVLDM
jgi:hypothetical protein